MRRWTSLGLLVLALQLAGCAPVTRPPDPTPEPEFKFIAFHVREIDSEAGIVGAVAELAGGAGGSDGTKSIADVNARVTFSNVPWVSTAIRVVITADGYETWNDVLTLPVQPTTDLDPIRLKRLRRARPGLVRIENRATVDDAGPFNPIGVTMFWALWAQRNDQAKLDANLAWLADRDVDFIRVLGTVGPGGGWEDRSVQFDGTWEADLAALIDRVYDKHGLRTELTIFGGAASTQTPAQRSAVTDAVLRVLPGREHKVILIEVTNEGQDFGGDGGRNEMRALGRRLNGATPVPVALTSATHSTGDACEVYGGDVADVATIHYERHFAADPPGWRPVRQPWGWPGEYGTGCDLPTAWNNEPIGPKSSVVADDDPRRLVLAYLTTFIAGNSAYVLHSGPGVRGGGIGDQPRGREANFWEAAPVDIALRAIQKLKAVIPPGLANWQKENDYWVGFPFDNGFRRAIEAGQLMRAYAAKSGGRFVLGVLGARAPVGAGAKAAYRVDVCDAVSGDCQQQLLDAGQALNLSGAEGYVVIGETR